MKARVVRRMSLHVLGPAQFIKECLVFGQVNGNIEGSRVSKLAVMDAQFSHVAVI